LTIVFYEQAFPEELARARKMKDMATKLGIPIVTNETLAEQRKARELAKAHAEFMND